MRITSFELCGAGASLAVPVYVCMAGRQSTTAGARPRARCELLRRARRRRPRAARQGTEGTASRVRDGPEQVQLRARGGRGRHLRVHRQGGPEEDRLQEPGGCLVGCSKEERDALQPPLFSFLCGQWRMPRTPTKTPLGGTVAARGHPNPLKRRRTGESRTLMGRERSSRAMQYDTRL